MKQTTKRFKNKSKKRKTMRRIKYGGMKRSASNGAIPKPPSVRHKSVLRPGSTSFKVDKEQKRSLQSRGESLHGKFMFLKENIHKPIGEIDPLPHFDLARVILRQYNGTDSDYTTTNIYASYITNQAADILWEIFKRPSIDMAKLKYVLEYFKITTERIMPRRYYDPNYKKDAYDPTDYEPNAKKPYENGDHLK
jgi:hypothetical protein